MYSPFICLDKGQYDEEMLITIANYQPAKKHIVQGRLWYSHNCKMIFSEVTAVKDQKATPQ